ncbi:MAG: iron ABC transporter permease [bacterium]|nr:iron ABC transporter permease [bacterium]
MKTNKYRSYKLILIILLLAISIFLSLFVSYKEDISSSFFNIFKMTSKTDIEIFQLLRIPRVLKALIAGGSLALAGMFIQSISKNPLAEPYITGISSGAAFGIICSITLFNSLNYSFFGFLGAIITAVVVISLAGIHKYSITKLILVGLSLNIFVGAIISLVILLIPEKSYMMMLLLSGGIAEDSMISNNMLSMMFLTGILGCVYCIPKLNFLRLDEKMILQSQKQKKLDEAIILILAAYLASISVFAAGIIGFVGIIIPQISKMLFGEDFRWLFISNTFLGAMLMIFADFLTRTLVYPLQLPLGLIIAFIGAPIFVFFLVKKGEIFND